MCLQKVVEAKKRLRARIIKIIDSEKMVFDIQDGGQAIGIHVSFSDVDEKSGSAITFSSWHEGGDTHPWLEKDFERFEKMLKESLKK